MKIYGVLRLHKVTCYKITEYLHIINLRKITYCKFTHHKSAKYYRMLQNIILCKFVIGLETYEIL
jgi:hypothetical protein